MNFDQFMAALCIFREARGSTVPQMNAVWHVLNNRVNDKAGRWPKYISDVVTEPFQFSSFNANDPGVTVFPSRKHAADWNAFQSCMLVVQNPLGDDPTQGANSYHTIPDTGYTYTDDHGYVVHLMPPSWADPTKLTLTLGPFKLYKL